MGWKIMIVVRDELQGTPSSSENSQGEEMKEGHCSW